MAPMTEEDMRTYMRPALVQWGYTCPSLMLAIRQKLVEGARLVKSEDDEEIKEGRKLILAAFLATRANYPLNDAMIATLTTRPVTSRDPPTLCRICGSHVSRGMIATFLPCGHFLHDYCAATTLKVRNQCPQGTGLHGPQPRQVSQFPDSALPWPNPSN